MPQNLPFDIGSLHEAYAAGLDPQAVIEECFRRLAEADDPGIFLHLAEKASVLAEAAALGPFDPVAKPLWGVPFAIKDNIDMAGAPTTAACPEFAYKADADSFVVAQLRAAGAIPIGKTNLDQFATGLVGVRTPYPVPRNALDPAIVPGGSSSGSGVVVARGIVSFSLGTDTAGSGRVPAALNSIVGLKPSLGALSNRGVVPACLSLDTISVFALTVADAYRVFRSCAVYDEADSFARDLPAPALTAPPPRFKLGVPDANTREFFGDDLQAAAFERALGLLAEQGAAIVEIDFTPFYDVARMLYEGAWVAERHAAIEDVLRDRPEVVFPVTRHIIEAAKKLSATDAFRGFYRLEDLKRRVAPVLAAVDLLCVPSIPTFYSVADLAADPIGPNARLGTYTNFVNLLDLCGMAVPTPSRADGRPGSVTLLARAGRDALVAAVAQELQAKSGAALGATGWPLPASVTTESAPAAGEVALVAVGAHMSGLPLNGELTRLGGRFLKATRTAASYRLYALAGGPPARPGLVFDPSGGAIEVEVWALPSHQVGTFIQGIPRPLGIGTLVLEDGSEVKGFICEPSGVDGAEDVTGFGGWRNFLKAQTARADQTQTDPNKETRHVSA